jgi:ABC-type antimicrobial peptide transport system permease subunit
MALGARRANVLALVGRELALLVVVGVMLGLGAAFALAHTLSSFLYEVKPLDAMAFTAGPILLIAAALLAGFLPARRAAGVDPTVTLRAECLTGPAT